MDRVGWLAAFLFTACGALRLARFNTSASAEIAPDSTFTGLPIPAAAGMVATTVLFCSKFNFAPLETPMIFLFEIYALSFLMVSSVKYESFKKTKLFSKNRFNVLVSIILVFIVIAQNPHLVLFLILTMYVISGPFSKLFWVVSKKKNNIKA
jgi:CDP-diacylglycerol--serine O-phosphatidyltransferase